jgi:hypothetical protein
MMIHTRSAVRLGIYDEIEKMCKKLGIAFVSIGHPEPPDGALLHKYRTRRHD